MHVHMHSKCAATCHDSCHNTLYMVKCMMSATNELLCMGMCKRSDDGG
jgi:hypothetical protein